jgi:hypothetical protein
LKPSVFRLGFRPEAAQDIHEKAYQQNEANSAATDDRASKVKPAAAKQDKKNK